ncbi:MAG: transposase, partial [Pseudomonadota bacterium]
ASRNIVPWGIVIGGEELHNNHHTFASSAKLSSKWWEFDIGWLYIRTLETVGLARVKKIPPELTCDTAKQHVDLDTVKAVINGRFHVMAQFARDVMHHVHREELKKADRRDRETWTLLKRAKRLMVRETTLLDDTARTWLQQALAHNATLHTVYSMKQRLADVWQRSATTQEHLRNALEEWCRQAEATGIQALREFALKLRTYRLVSAST